MVKISTNNHLPEPYAAEKPFYMSSEFLVRGAFIIFGIFAIIIGVSQHNPRKQQSGIPLIAGGLFSILLGCFGRFDCKDDFQFITSISTDSNSFRDRSSLHFTTSTGIIQRAAPGYSTDSSFGFTASTSPPTATGFSSSTPSRSSQPIGRADDRGESRPAATGFSCSVPRHG